MKKRKESKGLSKIESEIIEGFVKSIRESKALEEDDQKEHIRQQVMNIRGYHGVVEHLPSINWDEVFEKESCPNCNARITPPSSSNNYYHCPRCGLSIMAERWKSAEEHHMRAKKLNEYELELSKKIKNAKLGGERVRQLYEIALAQLEIEN